MGFRASLLAVTAAAALGISARAAAPGQSDIAGDWRVEIAAPGAPQAQGTLAFTGNGPALSGTMRLGDETVPLFEVQEQGTHIAFTAVIPGSPYVTVHYSGEVNGDALTLEGTGDDSSTVSLSAHRDGAPVAGVRVAGLPPPPTPIPPPEPKPQTAPVMPVPGTPPASAPLEPSAAEAGLPPPPAAEPKIASLPPAPPPRANPPAAPEAPPAPPLRPAEPAATATSAASQPPAAAPVQPSAPAASLDGQWRARQSSPGSAAAIDAALEFAGARGTMEVGAEDWPLFDVKQMGSAIRFTLVIPGTPYVTIHYAGTLMGDALDAASVDQNQGTFHLRAERGSGPLLASAEPSEPPQQQASAAPPPPSTSPAPQPNTASPPEPPPPPLSEVENGPPPSWRPIPASAAAPEATVTKLPLPPLHPVAPVGRMRIPPIGWATREKLGTMVDAEAVREAAEGLNVTGLKAAGYTTVELDDGWQGARDAGGVLHPNDKFPDMKALIAAVHGRGLKFGIATAAGPKSCDGKFAGSYGHETEDARAFADWGVDYVVYEWCGADKIYTTPAEMQAALQKMGEALSASGRDIAFGIDTNGSAAAAGFAPATGAKFWRTGKGVSDSWPSLVSNGFGDAGAVPATPPGHWLDPGLIQAGNGGMTTDEYRMQLNLWAVIGGPFLLGNEVRIMRRETVDLLTNKDVIAVDQDSGGPGRRVAKTGNTEVWAKPLADGSIAVGLFNHGDASAPVAVSWEQLGIQGPRQVRDLWWHQGIGTANNQYVVFLTGHTSLLLRMSK